MRPARVPVTSSQSPPIHMAESAVSFEKISHRSLKVLDLLGRVFERCHILQLHGSD